MKNHLGACKCIDYVTNRRYIHLLFITEMVTTVIVHYCQCNEATRMPQIPSPHATPNTILHLLKKKKPSKGPLRNSVCHLNVTKGSVKAAQVNCSCFSLSSMNESSNSLCNLFFLKMTSCISAVHQTRPGCE